MKNQDISAKEQAERPPQPPYTWPTYTPWNGQPWRSGGQFVPPPTRRRSRWPWFLLALVLLTMMLFGGLLLAFGIIGYGFAGYTNSAIETHHFTTSANPTLVLNNDTGSIHVRVSSSSSDVSIQATKHSGLWGNLNDVKVNYAQDEAGNTLTINVNRLNNTGFFNMASVDFVITVPSMASLQLKTNTGSIDVGGVSGRMVLTSNTGSVQVSDGMLSGNSQLVTNTGSITFNGAIDQSGNYQFQTNTGSVNVTLPGESVFHLDASTDTGSITATFPGVVVQQHQFVGADAHSDVGNAPQAIVSLKTNTGSINLSHS